MRPIKNDARYTIAQEFCGYSEKRYVLRFCGDFIAQSVSRNAMVVRAVGHNRLASGANAIIEERA